MNNFILFDYRYINTKNVTSYTIVENKKESNYKLVCVTSALYIGKTSSYSMKDDSQNEINNLIDVCNFENTILEKFGFETSEEAIAWGKEKFEGFIHIGNDKYVNPDRIEAIFVLKDKSCNQYYITFIIDVMKEISFNSENKEVSVLPNVLISPYYDSVEEAEGFINYSFGNSKYVPHPTSLN